MHHVLVFSTSTSSQDGAGLTMDHIQDLTDGLAGSHNSNWLAAGIAAEYHCDIIEADSIETFRRRGEALHIDVNYLPASARKKKLFIADMDSTIIEGESLDDMAELAGLGDIIAAITTRAMAGELDFEQALDERVSMLAGHPATLFDKALSATKLMPGAFTAIQTMRAHGVFCYLVSGGFTAIAARIAAQCGFTGYHANEMMLEDGIITGSVKKPVLGREAKANFLSHYTAQHNLTPAESLCVGDGANDMAMLQAAGIGVAYQGKPLLRKAIDIQLNHTDLTGLLFLQGYRADEFSADSPM